MGSASHDIMPTQQQENRPSSVANAATQDTTGALSLPVQSDSSFDDDDDDSVVAKTSRQVAVNGKADITESSSKTSLAGTVPSLSDNDTETQDSSIAARRPHTETTCRWTSFDIETSPSPTKKRRVHSEGHVWDGFVRRGARLKGFLEDAMQLVATSHHVVVSDSDGNDKGTGEKGSDTTAAAMRQSERNHAADIARERTAECMILQKVRAAKIRLKLNAVSDLLDSHIARFPYRPFYRNSKRPRPLQLP